MSEQKDSKLNRILINAGRYRLFGIVVSLLLLAVLAAHLLIPDKHFSEQEKRVLTQVPALSWDLKNRS